MSVALRRVLMGVHDCFLDAYLGETLSTRNAVHLVSVERGSSFRRRLLMLRSLNGHFGEESLSFWSCLLVSEYCVLLSGTNIQRADHGIRGNRRVGTLDSAR